MSARHAGHRVLGLTAIFVASLVPAPAGLAATVSVRGPEDGILHYVAAVGEANNVAIVSVGDSRMRITDAGAVITPGARCRSMDAHSAICRGRGAHPLFYEAKLQLGDADDHLAPSGDVDITADGGAGNDVINGSILQGGEGDDRLLGTDSYDKLQGGAGNDQIRAGGGGSDELLGGPGNDHLFAGSDRFSGAYLDGGGGQDQLFGGPGDDTLRDGDRDGVAIDAAPGPDTLEGGAGTDTLNYGARKRAVRVHLPVDPDAGEVGEHDSVRGIESVTGGVGGDVLVGDQRANILVGRRGNDTLDGGGGNDVLNGGAGLDAVECGSGRDTVSDPTLREQLSRSCEEADLSFDCDCFGELFVYLQPERSRRRELRFRLLCPFVDSDAVIGCRGAITLREARRPHRILGRGHFRHRRAAHSLTFPALVALTSAGSKWWTGTHGRRRAIVSLRFRARFTPRRPFRWTIPSPQRS